VTFSVLTILTISIAEAKEEKASIPSARDAAILGKVKTHPAYRTLVEQAKSQKQGFLCRSVSEVIETKDYSLSSQQSAVYSLAVLECLYNPQDGLGVIRQSGLAVFSGEQIVSFTIVDIPQPE
jgi:hypothetical protein